MKNHKKLTLWTGAIYLVAIILSILLFPFLVQGDGSGAWLHLFVFEIGIFIIAAAVYTFISAISAGARISVLAMPVIFFIGSFVDTFLTWNLHWYRVGSAEPFRIQWGRPISALIACAVGLALGLAVHYAIKYFKKSKTAA